MEIITIVLEGEMTHEDSMGNKTVIRAGDVQRMSAGTGLTHSEFNLAQTPVNFYQIWIFPDQRGLEPSYDQKSFSKGSWRNTLLPIASGQGIEETVTFYTAATIYRCDLKKNKNVVHMATEGRRILLYVTKGEVNANGTTVSEKYQARIDIDEPLKLSARESAEFILINVPSCKGWGYSADTLKGKSKKTHEPPRVFRRPG